MEDNEKGLILSFEAGLRKRQKARAEKASEPLTQQGLAHAAQEGYQQYVAEFNTPENTEIKNTYLQTFMALSNIDNNIGTGSIIRRRSRAFMDALDYIKGNYAQNDSVEDKEISPSIYAAHLLVLSLQLKEDIKDDIVSKKTIEMATKSHSIRKNKCDIHSDTVCPQTKTLHLARVLGELNTHLKLMNNVYKSGDPLTNDELKEVFDTLNHVKHLNLHATDISVEALINAKAQDLTTSIDDLSEKYCLRTPPTLTLV